MLTLETPDSERPLNADVASMVREIAKIGPRVPEIARRLGKHKETVRYWYKKLGEHDFAIQGILNHEALGLKRLVIELQFEELYGDYIKPLMIALNELCYVVSYSKSLTEDLYIVNASVPQEFFSEYLGLIDKLKEQGVFKVINYYVLDWVRNVPMRAELYDFENGHWDLDYPSLLKKEPISAERPTPEKVKFDRIDLLIAKELQIDATRELKEIQQAIKETDGVDINYKTLCWHLSEHVEGHGLLKGYKINWMGTRWDPVADRAKHRSHSYVIMTILVKNPSNEQKARLMRMVDRLPTAWSEGAGDDFFAEVALPSETMLDGLRFLEKEMSEVRGFSSFHLVDQRNAGAFTLSYKLFDETKASWQFNREELQVRFQALESEIRAR